MNFAELDAAAKVAAATVPDWFDDTRQEAWVRFLRYRPRTIGGAMMMAFSARNDLLRKERTQRTLGVPRRHRKPDRIRQTIERWNAMYG